MRNVRKSLAAFAALVFAYSIQAGGSATFSPTTLPDATVGVSYSATVSVSADATIQGGGAKSALPAGITRCVWNSSAGVFLITGTPTTAGTHKFTLMVQFSDRTQAEQEIALTVKPADGGGSTGGETGGGETGGGDEGGGDEGGGSSGGDEGGGTGGETIYITGKTPSSASVEMVTGAKQTFSVEINNPAASVRYAWYCGPRLGSTTVIPGATASSYEYQCTGEEVNLMVYVLPAEGSGVHEAFTWYITPKEPDPVPTVTGFSPSSANLSPKVGGSVSLYASVENATSDITYLWEMDSTGSGRSFVEISGTTGSSYTYRPTSAGTVMIRVTVKNGEGTPLDNGTKTWTIAATESTTTMTLSRSSPASESVSIKDSK